MSDLKHIYGTVKSGTVESKVVLGRRALIFDLRSAHEPLMCRVFSYNPAHEKLFGDGAINLSIRAKAADEVTTLVFRKVAPRAVFEAVDIEQCCGKCNRPLSVSPK